MDKEELAKRDIVKITDPEEELYGCYGYILDESGKQITTAMPFYKPEGIHTQVRTYYEGQYTIILRQ